MTQPSTNTTTVESPLSALRRKWWLALILCPAGAALGVAAGAATTTHYTVETQLSVGAGELSAQAVPGFALARQQLAEDYARWVQNDSAEVNGNDVKITASPIPNSAVIRIEGESADKDAATQAVKQKAAALTQHVNASKPGNDPAQVLKQYQAVARTAAQADADYEAANGRLQSGIGSRLLGDAEIAQRKAEATRTKTAAATVDVRRDALAQKYQQLIANQTTAVNLTSIRAPHLTGDDRSAKMERYGLLGLVLGGLASLLIAAMTGRRRVVRPQGEAGRRPVRTSPQGAAPGAGTRAGAEDDVPWSTTRADDSGGAGSRAARMGGDERTRR